jgi:hypothetical protein
MHEQWIRWEPVNGLKGKYDVESIISDDNGLIVRLCPYSSDSHKVELTFKPYAQAYRQTDESFRTALFHDLSEKYGKGFYAHWTFFKVVESEYLAWLDKESCTYSTAIGFEHFALICDDSVVDIISRNEPIVSFIN